MIRQYLETAESLIVTAIAAGIVVYLTFGHQRHSIIVDSAPAREIVR